MSWDQFRTIVLDNDLGPFRRQPLSKTILTPANAAVQRPQIELLDIFLIILYDTNDDRSINLIIIFRDQYCTIVLDNDLGPVHRQPLSKTMLTPIIAD